MVESAGTFLVSVAITINNATGLDLDMVLINISALGDIYNYNEGQIL